MDIEISQETCCKCNVIYWITTEHRQRLIKCKNIFYCPNGHHQAYTGKTEAQKIENLERKLNYATQIKECFARSNSALRGVITRNQNAKTFDLTVLRG